MIDSKYLIASSIEGIVVLDLVQSGHQFVLSFHGVGVQVPQAVPRGTITLIQRGGQ